MRTLILIALLFASTMAVTMKRPMTNAQIQKYDSKWASIMMNMAELHMMSQGPLDQLVDAIEEVVADLERKVERAHNEYDRRSNEHDAEVSRINGQIGQANADIAHTTEFLQNVLYVQRDTLTMDIANLQESIERTNQYIQDQTNLRKQENERFHQVVEEHNSALDAVKEAVEVLSQINEGASLLQVKKAKKSLDKVQQKISKNVEGSMVKALLALTSGEFANSDALRRVRELLAQVQNNLVQSVANYTLEEQQAQDSFKADVANKKAEINQMSLEITEKTGQLATTNESIQFNEEFLVQRKRDLEQYQEDLVQENARFEKITQLYEELVAQLEVEQRACAEALDILSGSDIAGYIGGRMSQDVIIDQPHGMGVTVESNPFDLE